MSSIHNYSPLNVEFSTPELVITPATEELLQKADQVGERVLTTVKKTGIQWKDKVVKAFSEMPNLSEDSDDEGAEETIAKKETQDASEKVRKKAQKAAEESKPVKKGKKTKDIEKAPLLEPDLTDTMETGLLTANEIALERLETPAKVAKVKKPKKIKESFGIKHLSWMIGGAALTMGLSVLFRDQPVIAISIMGAWLDFIRVAYKSIPQGGWAQNSLRAAALCSFIISILANYFTPKDSIWNALPFFSFALAVLIKCEWNKIDLESKITQRFGFNKKPVLLASATVQGAIATLFTARSLPALIQAPAAIIAKSKFRSLANLYFKKITSLENATVKKTALAMTYALLPALGTLSFISLKNNWISNPVALMALALANTSAFDTTARLFKNFLWKLAESDETTGSEKNKDASETTWKTQFMDFIKKTPRGVLLITAIMLTAYPLDKLLISGSIPPAILAVISQEVGTLFKPLLKGFVGTRTGLFMILPTILLLSMGLIENQLARALLADNALFGMKDMVRPKKITQPKEPKVLELLDEAASLS